MDRELQEISNDKLCGTPTTPLRTATAISWQTRPPLWRPYQQRAAAFYSAKSMPPVAALTLSMNGIAHIIVPFKTSDLLRGQIVSELTRR